MCVCVGKWVCKWIRMCLCMYVHICVYIYMCVWVRVYVLMYVYMYVCVYVCDYVYMYSCMHMCLCMYVCMYVCMCLYVCMYVTLIRFSRYRIAFCDLMAPSAGRINLPITKRDSKLVFIQFPKLNCNLSVVKMIIKIWHFRRRIIQWVSNARKFCSGGRRSLGFWGGSGGGPCDIANFTFPYDSG